MRRDAAGCVWSLYETLLGWMVSSVRYSDGMHTAWLLPSPDRAGAEQDVATLQLDMSVTMTDPIPLESP